MEERIVCSNCGVELAPHEVRYDDGDPLCEECFDRNYFTCADCDEVIRREDAFSDGFDLYCEDCWNNRHYDKVIHDYCYKPEPIFYGKGGRYFGVELEVDDGGELSDNASKILQVANRKREHLYCKHDGSIEDGFELVSHPMTLEYHMQDMPWVEVLAEAQRLCYRSHQTSTCGLHIHVNRDSFGSNEEEQDAAIARVLYFFEKNWEELLRFSRRSRGQLERWAARYGYKEQPKEILDHAKKGFYAHRYTCVNLQNANTVEFRIFRGTLKYNTFIATLQLVNRVCEVAISLSDEQMRQLTWSEFAAGCDKAELVQYLKERRLYVNEEIVGTEEV